MLTSVLDHNLHKLYQVKDLDSREASLRKNNIQAVRNFNPYEILNDNLPPTFYEILSLYNNFMSVACTTRRTSSYFRALDLDTSYGFTMATQGKYSKAFILGMPSVYKDIDRSVFDMSRLHIESQTYEALETSCNEDGGCDVVFCSEVDEEENIRRFGLCVDLTSSLGTFFYRTFDPESHNTKSLVLRYSKFFATVSLYKPATTSCVSKECYVVMQGRLAESLNHTDKEEEYDKQTKALNHYQRLAIQRINKGTINKANVSAAMAEYLGF